MKSTKIGVIAAFLYLYLVWGSTFLAIKVAVQETPPFVVGALRFLTAGLVMLLIARRCSPKRLTPRGARAAALVGVLMAGIGNGSVIYAQQTVPSGIASLWVATVPVWILALNALFFARSAPSLLSLVGVTLGCAGIALLPGATASSSSGSTLIPMVVLVVGCVGWSVATLWQRHRSEPGTALHAAAVQATSGGAFLAVLALVSGQGSAFLASPPGTASVLSLAYLAVFGTALAYTFYSWLLGVVDAQKVSTYALVNPIVAMCLGTWLGGEPLTSEAIVAGALVLAAVALILWKRPARARVAQGTATPHLVSAPARASSGRP